MTPEQKLAAELDSIARYPNDAFKGLRTPYNPFDDQTPPAHKRAYLILEPIRVTPSMAWVAIIVFLAFAFPPMAAAFLGIGVLVWVLRVLGQMLNRWIDVKTHI